MFALGTWHGKRAAGAWALAGAALLLAGCVRGPVVRPVNAVPAEWWNEPVKLHMRDGTLYHLDRALIGPAVIRGPGSRYDVYRRLLQRGELEVRRADIALVEGSETHPLRPGLGVLMGMVTVLSAALTVYCIANPKACWGSCPTFYLPTARDWVVQAEGFSTSVARSLEAEDIDDLPDAAPRDGALVLAMRNEALETHAIRRLSLLVVDGPAGSFVAQQTTGGFAALGDLAPPTRADADGDIRALLAGRDGHEYTPGSDGVDLATRTSVTLRFAPPGRRDAGLVLTARNSLMSTYVFYHLLALLGTRAGEFVAALERLEPRALRALWGFDSTLGGIAVEVRQGNEPWRTVGGMAYTGPIARSTRVVVFALARPDEPVEVRLTMARSHWRLDAARLAPVLATGLQPVEVFPQVQDAGRHAPGQVAAQVRGQGEHLVTLPGDEIRFRFPLPRPRGAPAYFLRSRGFYYEWMRKEWLKDENVPLAWRYLDDPRAALRELAPAYRRVEPTMDAVFQSTRFGRPGVR